MDTTILVAKLLGIYLIVGGLFLIIKKKTVPYMLKDFFQHPALIFLTGVILIFLSSLFLLNNNIWNNSWRTLVTVFVWLVLFKGLAYIFIPKVLNEIATTKYRKLSNFYGLLAIIVGVVLVFLK